MTAEKETEKVTFEAALQELETIVNKMEQGDLPLEESLAAFERGVNLAKVGQETLKNAEQKVQILMQSAGEETLEDFQTPEQEENQ